MYYVTQHSNSEVVCHQIVQYSYFTKCHYSLGYSGQDRDIKMILTAFYSPYLDLSNGVQLVQLVMSKVHARKTFEN